MCRASSPLRRQCAPRRGGSEERASDSASSPPHTKHRDWLFQKSIRMHINDLFAEPEFPPMGLLLKKGMATVLGSIATYATRCSSGMSGPVPEPSMIVRWPIHTGDPIPEPYVASSHIAL